MKKVIISMVFLALLHSVAHTQVHKHSIGLGLNSQLGRFPPLVKYQYGFNNGSRLDFSLAFNKWINGLENYTHFFGKAYYQNVWNIKGGLNWYAGVGAQYNFYHRNLLGIQNTYSSLSIGPQIGLEYDFNQFNVPLLFSFDYSPLINTNTGAGIIRHTVSTSLLFTINSKKKKKQ